MSSHRLKMNPDKTQLLWIGTSRPQLSEVAVNEVALSTGPLGFSPVVSNLGVLFDEQLSVADHVTAVCKSCFFQLRLLRLIRSCLTMDSAETLVHAFISSRLNYRNTQIRPHYTNPTGFALASGRPADKIQDRDAGQQCLRGLVPPYLAELCQSVVELAGRQHLRSAASGKLSVQWTATTIGRRNFAVSGPDIWNSLPSYQRTCVFRHCRRQLLHDT